MHILGSLPSATLFAFVCLLCAVASAEDDRDNLFFSESNETREAPSASSGSADGPAVSSTETQPDSTQTIGGQLFLQTNVTVLNEQKLAEAAIAQRALFYLYLDHRPSSTTRVFARGSLLHPMGPESETRDTNIAFDRPTARIEELWLKMNIEQRLFLTVGTQPIRWGVGRIWNPTDFLNQQQKDPLEIFDARPGLSCIKLHVPFEHSGTNLYAFIRPGFENDLGDLRYSLRLEQVLGTAEWTLSADTGYDSPLKVGTDLSLGIGPIDLRVEVASQSTAPDARYAGTLDLTNGTLPTKLGREAWATQWTAGFEWGIAYHDDRSLYLTVEYFNNPLGYQNGANLYPWLLVEGAYRPLYLGQHYVGLNLALPGLGARKNQTILLSDISNLSDGTHITRLDYQITVLTRLRLSAFLSVFLGQQGEFRYALEIPAGIAGPDPISVPAVNGTGGLWASIGF